MRSRSLSRLADEYRREGRSQRETVFSSESPPQFVGTIVIGNNWGEGKKEAATDKVFSSDGGFVSAGFSVWGERNGEMIGDVG